MSSITKFVTGRLLRRSLIFGEEVFFGHLFDDWDLDLHKILGRWKVQTLGTSECLLRRISRYIVWGVSLHDDPVRLNLRELHAVGWLVSVLRLHMHQGEWVVAHVLVRCEKPVHPFDGLLLWRLFSAYLNFHCLLRLVWRVPVLLSLNSHLQIL